VLSPDHAIASAARHQRRAIRAAAAFADALGEPVGFLCRRDPEGMEFEAVALDSARTCAIVGPDGRLRHVSGGAPRDPSRRPGRLVRGTAERTGVRSAAERALAASARTR
jgi:hypothetical protein